jgi:hypothetical protein
MSKTPWIIAGIVAIGFAVTAFIVGLTVMNVYNGAATLKNQYTMQVSANEATFDNMWKKVQQSAQLADAQKNGFREVFESYATGRTAEGQGRIMAWIKEAAPRVDLSLYKNVLNIITGSRDEWTRNQVELVSIAEQYNLKLSTFPSNFILKMFGFEKIDPKIISSTRTKNAFETGKDDDVSLPVSAAPVKK